MKQTPSPDQSLGWTVPEQSGGGVFQPKHAVLHHTETQCLRDLSLEKGALKVVCCNESTKSWMGRKSFWLRWTYTQKKDKKKDKRQTKRVNDLYVWCMMFWGHLPDSRYTGTLQNCLRWACVHCECLRLANWPPEEGENKTFWGRRDGLVDGAGLVPMLLWTEWVFWGKCSTCVFPPVAVWRWCRMEVPACLEEGGGPLKPSRLCVWWEREGGCFFWSVTQGPKLPPTWSLYDRSFFFFWCFWCSY